MKILFLSRIYNEAFDNFSLDIINTQKEIDIFFENQARFHCNWLDEFFFLLKKNFKVKIVYPNLFKNKYLKNIDERLYVREFLQDFEPDIIISGSEMNDFIQIIKLNINKRIPIVLWKSSRINGNNLRALKSFYTHVITDNLYLKELFNSLGLSSFFLLPSVPSSITSNNVNFIKRTNKIFFSGSLGHEFIERKKIITYLIKKKINIEVRSRDLNNNYKILNIINSFFNFFMNKNIIINLSKNFFFKNIKKINQKPLFGKELFDYMKKFRFILNFHSDFDKNIAVNYRVFESLASGSLLFTDENSAQSLLFKDQQHLVCYKDKEDLIKKISYYNNNLSEANQIALNGYNLIKAKHTCDVRINDFIKILEKIS
jgi:spore maturation protein CgeB